MRDGPCEPIEAPDAYDIEPPPMCVGHQTVQFWTGIFRSADARINVLAGDVPAACLYELPQLPCLEAHILAVVNGGNPRINCDSSGHRHRLTKPLPIIRAA